MAVPKENPKRPPPVTPELVTWLASMYPDRCPDEADSDRTVWMDAGAAKVVRRLRLEMERQTNNVTDEQVLTK